MVKIISDSTCDLSQELLEQYDISILPLHILLGEEEYRDRVEISPDDIFSWAEKNKQTPKTSAPSFEDTLDLFRPYLEEGRELICFAISEDMSTSANVMRLAAAELEAAERVFVVDSENLSTGIGLLVTEAGRMAGAGKTVQEILSRIRKLIPLVRSSFVVDTLTYLYRGGRCTGLEAMAGSVLRLHPKIVVEHGKMKSTKKYRGKIGKVIQMYAKDLEAELLRAEEDRVFVTHSGCDPDIVKQVVDYLDSLHHFDHIYETRAGGVISSHCGPGTLGVLFIAKD